MLEKILSLFGLSDGNTETPSRPIDTTRIIQQIRSREEHDIPQGKLIYSLELEAYSLHLDHEFTGHYRISVFLGNHKIFGFTITEEDISDEEFAAIWETIIRFLRDDPSPKKMPNTSLLKSHFFGKP